MTPAVCVNREALVAYWIGELEADRARVVEEHVFGCATCADRLGELATLAAGTAEVVRRGGVAAAIPSSVLDRFALEGKRVRVLDARPGIVTPCTIAPDDDLVVAALHADLSSATRVDLEQVDADGHVVRMSDVPIDRMRSRVLFCPVVERVRSAGAIRFAFRLIAVEPRGERLVAEFPFAHRPWAPH